MRTLIWILGLVAIGLGTALAVVPSPTGAVVGTNAELTTFWSLILVVGGVLGIAVSGLEGKLEEKGATPNKADAASSTTHSPDDLDEKMRKYASLNPKYAAFLVKNEYVDNAAAKALFDRRVPERGKDLVRIAKDSGLAYDDTRGRLYDPITNRTIASVHVHGNGKGNSIHTHRSALQCIAQWEPNYRKQDRENGIKNRARDDASP